MIQAVDFSLSYWKTIPLGASPSVRGVGSHRARISVEPRIPAPQSSSKPGRGGARPHFVAPGDLFL